MKEYIFQTNKGRVLILAKDQEQAEQALRNSKKFTSARFMGVQLPSNV